MASALLRGMGVSAAGGGFALDRATELAVSSLTDDSRAVEPGAAFVAVVGATVDGHDYLEAAIQKGASLLVVEREPAPSSPAAATPWVKVDHTRSILSELASRVMGEPTLELELVGITGTNGKTTTSYLLEAILRAAGQSTGLLGTVVQRWSDGSGAAEVLPSAMTTPDAVSLQTSLSAMRDAGVESVVMEVSSHALDQFRVDGCHFAVAAFTSLGSDHLDYHGSREAYFAAKKRLFTDVLMQSARARGAVVCIDTPEGCEVADETAGQVIRVASRPVDGADVWLDAEAAGLEGYRGQLCAFGQQEPFVLPMVGEHNLQNFVVAAGCAIALQVTPARIAGSIGAFGVVPGRMERVPAAGPGLPAVVVDYAHTAGALERALAALRPVTEQNLWVVFGCGGDRDRQKRPEMGRAAAAGADIVVVTSDNPRSESPEAIAEAAAAGSEAAGSTRVDGGVPSAGQFAVEVDRAKAIALAATAAGPGDVVLIAGKGHEKTQEVSGAFHPFDDVEIATDVLRIRVEQGRV